MSATMMRLFGPAPAWLGGGGFRPAITGLGEGRLEERINRRYDNAMYSKFIDEYYGHSDLHNYGYWTPDTRTQREASQNLVDVLIGYFPKRTGNILDVACGKGGSTKRLLMRYHPKDVTGINISEKQLATCRKNAPGCRFVLMDATELRFPDSSFDSILCIEAAFHFDTREKFLREAYRVLKPGGCLALSDILLRAGGLAAYMNRIPAANHVSTVPEYRSLYLRAGFENVRVVEARKQCWEGFRDYSFAYARAKTLVGELPPAQLRRIAASLAMNDRGFATYVLVSACKPQKGGFEGS